MGIAKSSRSAFLAASAGFGGALVLPAVTFARDVIYREPFSLGSGVTIDTSSSDDGFLSCARTGWPNPPGDSTYMQAAANLAHYRARNVSQLVLVGHGNSGLISTGDGQTPHTSTGYITVGTYLSWKPYFKAVGGHGTILTLCGCDCAVGAAGTTFLQYLANAVNCPVRGRTGLVYLSCPGAYISYEPGSVWQTAVPGGSLEPIQAPFIPVDSPSLSEIRTPGAVFQIGALQEVELSRGGRSQTLSGSDARSIASLANLGHPHVLDAQIGAVLTGRLTLSLSQNGQIVKKGFLVYNDRVLRDEADSRVYYFPSSAFSQELGTV